ncbi:MAG TPA: glycosyltransferase family 1 protein [candidate division WWE3 bacterium]|uniref:Glycosyltransferase family 1 protein n=1 Tax=candidate division WWE3 bacterium TaxID=2053526 RepID=A0A7C1P5X5_UNCKA|nr:glycosyltransferase family 1 protein [candidate division WWE3 bacterium]
MRIGIDARFLGPQGIGIGRYTQELVENLEKVDGSTSSPRGKKNEYVIFLRKENFDLYRPKSKNFKKVLADVHWYTLKEQIVLPSIFSREDLDLLHVPHFNAPMFYWGKTVITIHDLIKHEHGGESATTLIYPIYLIKQFGYRFVIARASKKARAIITPSNFVKEKVVKTFKIDPKKIYVTYESGTLSGKERTREEKGVEEVLGKYKITKPYFLYVGNVYPYKNVGRLLDAIKILNEEKGKGVQLVLVGARDVFRQRLEREIVEKGVLKYVVLTGYVTDADLIDLYKEAEAHVQPSLSEGFGLTSVEAMSLGAPVVQSDASCLPEVAGDAALYFDPYNPSDMAEKLAKVLGNKKLRESLSKKGLKRAKDFSWERMAKETLEVYKSAVR